MSDHEWRTLIGAFAGSMVVGLIASSLARCFHATEDEALRIYFLVFLVMIPYAYRCFR